MVTTPWLIYPKPNPQASLRLFCFSYSGVGASFFRSWLNELPPNIEICCVQLPGRESRFRESPFTHYLPLVQTLAPILIPHLDFPFAFFGHSLGALICFEIARQLRRFNHNMPLHLFVSGRRAPQILDPDPPISQLPDAEFIDELRRYNGTPEAVLQNTELMNLFLPIVRADLAINETYVYTPETPLDCSISAFGGLEDSKADYASVAAWREQTSTHFSLQMFPGDHFFLKSQQKELLQAICQDISKVSS